MDVGIAAIAAAIISGLTSTLTAIFVAQVNARSQAEIIQALARNTTDPNFSVMPAKPSFSLKWLRAISWFLIIFLRILGVLAIVLILCFADLFPMQVHRAFDLDPNGSPGAIGSSWPIWVLLLSSFFTFVVSVIAKRDLGSPH